MTSNSPWLRRVRFLGWFLCSGALSGSALISPVSLVAAEPGKVFRAGAHAVDVTPTNFPVIINGGFFAVLANQASDRLHARCLVLDDGETRVGLCVLDSCLIPREFADRAKVEIQKATGLLPERVMISATHSHSAPSLMAAHGADEDPVYPAYLLPRLVDGFRQAVSNLAPARVGWAKVPAPEYTHTRVWIRRPDRVEADPFGVRLVRANMHPGYENPAVIAPSGPSDPDLSLLAVQALDGRPVAVLANYSMHYHGGVQPVSADYYGRFADRLAERLVGQGGAAANAMTRPFVGIMSQGTSGDQQWMDYGRAQTNVTTDAYAAALAGLAQEAYQRIEWRDWAPLVMQDRDLPLPTRQPSAERLAWARGVVEAFRGRAPKTQPEIYAREQIWLHEHPVRPVKLQALRVGDLGLAMVSAEVFAISGLKVKTQSPLPSTFLIELANGEDGYIPPPEHHVLGSYNTWACRTACLEVDAENKIVDRLLGMLEEVSGQPRRPLADSDGPYAAAIRSSKPAAYWRMNEFDGRSLPAGRGRDRAVTCEPGVVFYLEGPVSPAFSGSNEVNRAYHFAGGRLKTTARGLGPAYSVEFWFWNGLPVTARDVTGYLFSRGEDGVYGAPGEHLAIGGARVGPGRLVFSNGGSDTSTALVGHTELAVKTWHHVVLARDGRRVAVWLDGDPEPEIAGEIDADAQSRSAAEQIFFGGRSDRVAGFEGKLDEIAVYARALGGDEAAEHFRTAGLTRPAAPVSSGPGGAGLWPVASSMAALRPMARWLTPPGLGSAFPEAAGGVRVSAEDGVTLPGPEAAAGTFAGGRLRATVPALGSNYTVAFWFRNEMPNGSRPVTAYLFSRGEDGASGAPGDHLGIGGTHRHAGRLILFNGNERDQLLAGRTEIPPGTWHHVVLVREGPRAVVYLDGQRDPDLQGEIEPGHPPSVAQLFFGGRSDNFANLNGRMSDIIVFGRALRADEVPALDRPAGGAIRAAAGTNSLGAVAGPVSGPVAPEDSVARLHVRAGFQAELVAAEPLLESPVAIDWDEQGRLWVVEMVDYPLGLDGRGKPGGCVRFLEDTNHDGRYDRSTLFAEGLSFPTGILTWRGGVLVTAAPEILFLQDTNGDGRADVRKVLYSGFFEGNQQLRVNGLRWGLDNWVYCASGAAWRGYGPGTGLKSHLNGREYAVGSRDFRIRPDGGELDPQSGPSQFGRNRDDWGNWFGVQNSWPLWHYVLADHYVRRNPHLPAPDPVHQVVRPMNPPVYPVSPREKRFHSFDQAGHFTSACSGMIYQDELLFGPGNAEGVRHAFTCEPFHNLVQHQLVTDDGVTFDSHRAGEETGHDFFASEDRWCRPVMTRTGPDGALWVVDMYRYMIEHPEWLPAEGRAELLPHYRLGEERGRIYRVFERSRPPRPGPALGALPSSELVATLASPNGWQRDKAQMLLLWRNDPAAGPLLESLARDSATALGRLHALCTLDGLGRLSADLVERALADPHPGVRLHALRLAETRVTPSIIAAAARLVDDPNPKVLLQLACTLGEWKDARAGDALGRLAVARHADPYITAAVLSSAVPHSLALVNAVVAAGGGARERYAGPLIDLTLAAGQRDSLERLLEPMLRPDAEGGSTTEQVEEFAAVLDALARRKTTWRSLAESPENDSLSRRLRRVPDVFRAARRIADAPERPAAARAGAAALLVRDESSREAGLNVLSLLLSPKTPGEAQRAAVRALAVSGDVSVPDRLVKAWPALGPEVRAAALDELLGREPWCYELADRLAAGQIPAGALDASRQDRLLRHSSSRVRGAAAKALAGSSRPTRARAIEDFHSAVNLAGDAARGREIFGRLCATCHRLGGLGTEIGPNLQSVANHPAGKLLVSILDPNASIQPGYTAYTARLTDGEEVYGLIAAETGNSLVLKLPDGKTRTVLRAHLESLESANLSLMPEGLEAGLTPQNLADVIRFLQSPN